MREERRGARTPCTVTAPARVAGHRLPVWATKIGGDSLCLCTLEEDCERRQSGRWFGICTANTVAGRAGQGNSSAVCALARELVESWLAAGEVRCGCSRVAEQDREVFERLDSADRGAARKKRERPGAAGCPCTGGRTARVAVSTPSPYVRSLLQIFLYFLATPLFSSTSHQCTTGEANANARVRLTSRFDAARQNRTEQTAVGCSQRQCRRLAPASNKQARGKARQSTNNFVCMQNQRSRKFYGAGKAMRLPLLPTM